jgi:hypothetical protein
MLHAYAVLCLSQLYVPCYALYSHVHYALTAAHTMPLVATHAMPLAAICAMPLQLHTPCPLWLCVPCPIDGGSGISSPLCAELFALSTNASDFVVVASSAPTCKFDTSRALSGSWYSMCTILHPTVDYRVRCSSSQRIPSHLHYGISSTRC